MLTNVEPTAPIARRGWLMRLGAICILVAIVATVFVAIRYYLTAPAPRARSGSEQADFAWADHKAWIYLHGPAYTVTEHNGFEILTDYDFESGLRIQSHASRRGRPPEYCDAYNARIRELLNTE